MLAKFAAYFLTGSNFVLTDAAESIVNVFASSFAFFSIYLASQPRDENHPYGHGKVEYFSVFIEGSLIGIAAITIMVKSVYTIFYPNAIHDLLLGATIIGATGVVNGALGFLHDPQGKANAFHNYRSRRQAFAGRYGNQRIACCWVIAHKFHKNHLAGQCTVHTCRALYLIQQLQVGSKVSIRVDGRS